MGIARSSKPASGEIRLRCYLISRCCWGPVENGMYGMTGACYWDYLAGYNAWVIKDAISGGYIVDRVVSKYLYFLCGSIVFFIFKIIYYSLGSGSNVPRLYTLLGSKVYYISIEINFRNSG